jgi:hypothetical protein
LPSCAEQPVISALTLLMGISLLARVSGVPMNAGVSLLAQVAVSW